MLAAIQNDDSASIDQYVSRLEEVRCWAERCYAEEVLQH